MFMSHLFWFSKLLCYSYTMKLKQMCFEKLWGFLFICVKMYLSLFYHPNTGCIHFFKKCICATPMSPFFWIYKIISKYPWPLVSKFFASWYSLVALILLLSEWGKSCKNSICKFWVSGPRGAYLCLSFLRPSNKNAHEEDVSRLCEKASFLLALN